MSCHSSIVKGGWFLSATHMKLLGYVYVRPHMWNFLLPLYMLIFPCCPFGGGGRAVHHQYGRMFPMILLPRVHRQL